jgi:hypothetical protein
MKRVAPLAMLALAIMLASPAAGQIMPLPGNPAVVPPPPPPKIEVPAVPQLDAPPQAVPPAARPESFGDRVRQCLHDAAAAGLGPNERAAYSRACANQQ